MLVFKKCAKKEHEIVALSKVSNTDLLGRVRVKVLIIIPSLTSNKEADEIVDSYQTSVTTF